MKNKEGSRHWFTSLWGHLMVPFREIGKTGGQEVLEYIGAGGETEAPRGG